VTESGGGAENDAMSVMGTGLNIEAAEIGG
jgi:hypothetical protein